MQVQLELFNSGMIMYDLWMDDGFGLGLLGGIVSLICRMGSLSSNRAGVDLEANLSELYN